MVAPPSDDAPGTGWTVRRAAVLLGYGFLGAIGSVTVALVLVNLTQPVQPFVYHLFYLRVGPGEATVTAILTHFLGVAVIALGTVMVIGDGVSDRGGNLRRLGAGLALVVVPMALVFLAMALVGLASFLTALVVLATGLVGLPVLLRYRYGLRSGALPAFVGSVPVVVLLLLLAGFGIGWGWGYTMTAEAIPADSADDPVADFSDVPAVRNDLFSGDCETTPDGDQRCYLQLRGYEHEVTAVRFMDRYGVRCPYQDTVPEGDDAFVATRDGSYYRVTCSPHGD